MSVMLLSDKTFIDMTITAGAYSYYREDWFDCPCYIVVGMTEGMVRDRMRRLYFLNHSTYFDRYRHHVTDEQIELLVREFMSDSEIERGEKMDVYQMLRSCECLDYNIEGYDDDASVIWLRQIINRLQSHIINAIPEYKNTK